MRWRYLILGLFLAVPAATAIHFWPQWPAYYIEGGRQYLANDPAQRQLLFLSDDRKAGLPPVIERYDADSGRLTSSVQLRLDSPDPKMAMDNSAMISSELKTISVFNFGMDETSRFRMTGFIFDATNGNRRPGEFTFFGLFDRKGLSPNGRWFALVHGLGQLVVIDTQTCRTHFDASSPTGKYVNTGVYFSPDSRFLLYQWQVDEEAGRTIHLFNLETSQEEATFSLPEGRKLCEWRPNELRSYESLPRQQDGFLPVRRFRHTFDGKTLGPGVADLLLDCDEPLLSVPNLVVDTESWVGQFESHLPRQPNWVKLLDKIESTIGTKLIDRSKLPSLRGTVRIIDRATRAVRFEMDVPSVVQCRPAVDGTLLVVDTKPGPGIAITGLDLGAGMGAAPEPPPAPFGIYRTDGWPRWVWTALGGSVVFAAFALLGRWRHVVIRRRAIARA